VSASPKLHRENDVILSVCLGCLLRSKR